MRLVVAFGVGLAVSLFAWQWITDPAPREQRQLEEQVVLAARAALTGYIGEERGPLQVVDPLAPDRKIGKVYVYPTADGWQVSGHYRRSDEDRWHPWLMSLDGDARLRSLAVRDPDPALAARAAADPKLSVSR